ncbi:MAG: ATP-dependent Clp protease adaptor ClpS [Planctomycetaceae bacterium]|jgi:ATP-dependent Clp protease adaptor protein ClpS|nr:ATP-dependent Clp protease adaptor ClpS [Planctomycetaceae bacterium]
MSAAKTLTFPDPVSKTTVRPHKKTKKKKKEKKEPRYNVILWNDDVHTFDYVIIMLRSLFGFTVEAGLKLANEVHFTGRAIVFTSSLAESEIKRDQILAFGPDIFCPESTGPLIATLEKAPE